MSPLRKVIRARSTTVPRFFDGRVVGVRTSWDLILACGHSLTRFIEEKPDYHKCYMCPPIDEDEETTEVMPRRDK